MNSTQTEFRVSQSQRNDLRRVSHGIGMMTASILLLALFQLASLFSIGLMTLKIESSVMFFVWVLRLALPIGITSRVLSLIGLVLCLATPREARASGVILLSVTVIAIALILNILTALNIGEVSTHALNIARAANLIALVAFLYYLNLIGRFLGEERVSSNVRRCVGYGVAAISALLSVWLISSYSRAIALPLAVISSLLAVLAFLKYVGALEQARIALSNAASGVVTENLRPVSQTRSKVGRAVCVSIWGIALVLAIGASLEFRAPGILMVVMLSSAFFAMFVVFVAGKQSDAGEPLQLSPGSISHLMLRLSLLTIAVSFVGLLVAALLGIRLLA